VDDTAFCATKKDFVNLQESPIGFGDSCLEAMADLCKQLGYKPSKMWGNSFRNLLAIKSDCNLVPVTEVADD
jgi:hypothetical protein